MKHETEHKKHKGLVLFMFLPLYYKTVDSCFFDKFFSRELRGLREWNAKDRGVNSNQESLRVPFA